MYLERIRKYRCAYTIQIQYLQGGGGVREFPRGGFIGKLVRIGRTIGRLRIGVYGAGAAYFLILAAFPALALLLGVLRHTSLEASHLVSLLEGFLPQALLPEAELLIHDLYRSASRTFLGLSALTALWSASRGVYGLLRGLNAVYGAAENRGYFYTRLISVVYTFGFLLVLLLTLVLHVFGTELLEFLRRRSGGFFGFLLQIIDLRFFLLLILQTALFTLMYTFLPSRRSRLRDSLPGALLAAIGWTVFSHLFSLYAEYFPGRADLYGSVYAVALSMLWLYFCILILLYGGLLNRWILDTDFRK